MSYADFILWNISEVMFIWEVGVRAGVSGVGEDGVK